MRCLLFLPLLACSAMAARQDPAPWRFASGRAAIEIDAAATGQITRWVVDGKPMVAAREAASPLTLTTTGGRSARFRAQSSEPGEARLAVRGVLEGDGISTPATLQYAVAGEGAEVEVTLRAEPPGLGGEDVSELAWSLPLALEPRKRVYFRGEHGFDWETRYFYQFTVESAGHLLKNAERNEWRYFALDQMGPKAFRLWRAESEKTSPLLMQQGEAAAPYVQLSDREGGVTVEYPELAARAPKSLRADAGGGGVAIVQLWSRAFVPASPQTPHLFGEPHRIVLRAGVGKEALEATRASLNARVAKTPPPKPEAVMREPQWLRQTPLSTAAPVYVTGGYPFAAGELNDAAALRVECGGKAVPVQARPLAFWPDGSVKWAQLTFPIHPEEASGECPPPRVTLRNGKMLPVKITIGTAAPTAASAALEMREADGGVSIRNGGLELELGPGARWLKNLSLGGVSLLGPESGTALGFADYRLDPKALFPFDREAEGGREDRGQWSVERVGVEEAGPLRAVVRLEGMTSNEEPTRIIVRLELLAGRPELRITHSAEFRFKDPRRTFLTGMGLEFPLGPAAVGPARFAGFEPEADPARVQGGKLFQASPVQAELEWREGAEWHRQAGGGRAEGWLQSRGTKVQTVAAIRDFWQQAPKAVSARFENGGAIRLEFWPDSAAPMDVRRYSNWPHRAQGESVEPVDDWVTRKYYPEDPFVGVSRSSEALLYLAPAKEKMAAASLAADFQSPPLLYAGWERYASTGVVLPSSTADAWPRAWEAWTRFANFWLYHRELHQWYGMWNFGDVRHLFRRGYGWIVPPEKLIELLKLPPTNKKSASRPAKPFRKLDYQPANDWAFDNGRWGWSNTEGLPGLFMQNEYLRHGNRVVWFAAESMARHSRDVVTRHEGKWFGRGTRHGVQHWSDGDHEERQTTITEYRLQYFLSGEPRSREVVEKLYQGIYSKTPVNVDAAHSGRLGGLLFHWEVTGSKAEGEQLKAYTREFLSPDGLYAEPSVRFPGPQRTEPPRLLNDGTMFFHTFGGLHALIEYQQITGDPEIAASLIKLADSALARPEVLQSYRQGKVSAAQVFWPAVAFAALHAPDPQPYRHFLQEFMESAGWKLLYQSVTRDPAHWSGETGYLPAGVPMAFFWANWAPYTTAALGKDTVWSSAVARQFDAIEREGDPRPRQPVSLQTEFDNHPELDDYLGYQQPWKASAPSHESP